MLSRTYMHADARNRFGVAILTAAVLLSGCRSQEETSVQDILASSDDSRTWYCYASAEGDKWECSDRENRQAAARLPPAGLVRSAEPAPAPGPAPSPVESRQPAVPAAMETAEPALVASGPPPKPPDLSRVRSAVGSGPSDDSRQRAASILLLPPTFYTVQIIALTNEDGLLRYASENGVEDPLYAPIRHGSGTMYVLLLGVYPDLDAATAAKDAWLDAHEDAGAPWIRELASLQAAIRAAL